MCPTRTSISTSRIAKVGRFDRRDRDAGATEDHPANLDDERKRWYSSSPYIRWTIRRPSTHTESRWSVGRRASRNEMLAHETFELLQVLDALN
jgi:hypothetical protein